MILSCNFVIMALSSNDLKILNFYWPLTNTADVKLYDEFPLNPLGALFLITLFNCATVPDQQTCEPELALQSR